MNRWLRVPASEARIASLLDGERDAPDFAGHFHLPPLVEESRGSQIRVLCPTQPLTSRWPVIPPR